MKTIGPILAATAILAVSTAAQADDRRVGEVFATAANFCPAGTLRADGRAFKIAEHLALASVIANHFGGDGKTTFAVPNLSGGIKGMTVSGAPLTWCIVDEGDLPGP